MLGDLCPSCQERIPIGPHDPRERARFFDTLIEPTRDEVQRRFPYSEAEAAAMVEYEEAMREHARLMGDASRANTDAKREPILLSAAEVMNRASEALLRHTRLGVERSARIRRAYIEAAEPRSESAPPDGLVDRVRRAVRG